LTVLSLDIEPFCVSTKCTWTRAANTSDIVITLPQYRTAQVGATTIANTNVTLQYPLPDTIGSVSLTANNFRVIYKGAVAVVTAISSDRKKLTYSTNSTFTGTNDIVEIAYDTITVPYGDIGIYFPGVTTLDALNNPDLELSQTYRNGNYRVISNTRDTINRKMTVQPMLRFSTSDNHQTQFKKSVQTSGTCYVQLEDSYAQQNRYITGVSSWINIGSISLSDLGIYSPSNVNQKYKAFLVETFLSNRINGGYKSDEKGKNMIVRCACTSPDPNVSLSVYTFSRARLLIVASYTSTSSGNLGDVWPINLDVQSTSNVIGVNVYDPS